jgi:hypothetical protein
VGWARARACVDRRQRADPGRDRVAEPFEACSSLPDALSYGTKDQGSDDHENPTAESNRARDGRPSTTRDDRARGRISIGSYGLFAGFDPSRATLKPLPGDHDRGIGVGRHMFGHAALQEARDGTQPPRTDDDRVETVFLGNPLDRRCRIASWLK